MRTAWLIAVCLSPCAFGAPVVPDALIVQGFVTPKKGQPDLNVACSDVLSDEIYKAGKLNPILWSQGDPLFRAAIDDGLIKNPPSKPTLADAVKVQRALKAEYIVWVEATRVGDQIKGVITLYKSGKALWSDTQQSGLLTHGAFDQMGTLRAICHSWAQVSESGPLRNLQSVPAIQSPPPDPGRVTVPTEPQPAAPQQTGNEKIFQNANELLKAGKTAQAIVVLRDAVDSSPQDAERRIALIQMLLTTGEPVLAAQEARRASRLLPDNAKFRVLAARAWLQAGNGEEAQTDLNEMAAHQPGGLDRVLNAQALLFQFKLSQAIETLDADIAVKPHPDAFYYRSLAKALQSDEKGALTDIAKADPEEDAFRYTIGMSVLDNSMSKIADELRSLFDQASIKQAKEIADTVAFQTARAQATKALLEALKPEAAHKNSHARRVLAYNLLIQCLSDLRDYLDSHNDDTLNDARINLGEALKHFNGAKADFLEESKGNGANDRPAN